MAWKRRAAAILLARAGTKVLVADRDIKLAERTVEMITAEGGTAGRKPSTRRKRPIASNWSKKTVARFGRLDFLDNNVGIGSRGSVVERKAGRLPAGDAGERRDHVPALKARHSRP